MNESNSIHRFSVFLEFPLDELQTKRAEPTELSVLHPSASSGYERGFCGSDASHVNEVRASKRASDPRGPISEMPSGQESNVANGRLT